ncbi:MAG: hypothetical protein KDA41_10970, partial [Planctomycetales bacterium]|nr:hypothetical protein [Planctomycetales bacterium]
MKVCAVFCSLVMLGAAVIVVAAEPAPPAELTIPLPEKAQAAETLPAPQGEAPRAAQPLRIEIPLNVLGRGVAPADREEARRFGLDMANRGISFGLRFLDRGVTPDEARQFGLEMGERGAGFGVRIVGENIDLDALNLGGPDGLKLPKADAPP